MCKMRVVVGREMLGARETGWSLWDGKQVMELTAKQIKDIMRKGNKVCGLTLDDKGELIPDKEGFFTTNIMEHRHCGQYRPMVEAEGCMANLFYIVIGTKEEKGEKQYECISTKFEQLVLSEADVKAYLRIGIISAGARLNDKGEVEVASLEFKKPEPVKTEPVKEPVKVEEKKPEPVKEEPVKAEEKKPEPVKTEVPKMKK